MGGAEQVAVAQVGAGEHPVVVAVDGEGARPAWGGLPEPAVQPPPRSGAEERPLGQPDDRVGPHAGHPLRLAVGDDGVGVVGGVLVADHDVAGPAVGAGAVGDADLPEAGVAGEAGEVPAAADVRLDGGALAGGPVLVVADVDDQVVAVGDGGVVVEVGGDAGVEPVPGRFGPFDEASFVAEPSARTDGGRIGVGTAVLLEPIAVDVGFLAPTGGA